MLSATISQQEEYFMIPKEICETEECAATEAQEFLMSYMKDNHITIKFKLESITSAFDERNQPYWLVTFIPAVTNLTIN